MTVGLVVLAAALAALAALAIVPWRVALSVRAQGAEDGRWALAGGVELFHFAVAFAQASGAPPVLDVSFFGKRLARRTLTPSRPVVPTSPALPATKTEPLLTRYARLARWIDPLDLLLFVAGERRRLAIRDLEGSVCVGLRDVALAGQIAGVLAMLSALGSPFGALEYSLDWSGREHLEASLSLALRFSPALLALDTALYLARALRIRKSPPPAEEAPAP